MELTSKSLQTFCFHSFGGYKERWVGKFSGILKSEMLYV